MEQGDNMGLKEAIGKLKDKAKAMKEKSDSDKAWKNSIRDEAKLEARAEAKDELKKIYKEEEKNKIIKGNNPLQKLGDGLKTSGLGTDDKISRLLGKSSSNTDTKGFDSTSKINRVLGKDTSGGNFNVADKILHKKETSYGDVVKDNKVVYSADEQRTKDKNDRIAKMLR